MDVDGLSNRPRDGRRGQASHDGVFRSAFVIRGFGAGHERRHDVHVQNEIAVPPVSTCSFFTNAESRHPGHTGGCSLCDSRGRRLRAVDIGVLGREPIIKRRC